MREVNENQLEEMLSNQIPEAEIKSEKSNDVNNEPVNNNAASQYLGTKLSHKIGGYCESDKEEDKKLVDDKKLTRVGEKIGESADIRDGWMDVDRRLLGDRNVFYPKDWNFRIRPATVEAIRNWSTIDDENPNSVDDVFTEIIKNCLTIVTPKGLIPCTNIRSWDRFFFILLIREYTFINGEKKVEYYEDCPNCNNSVTFNLTSQSLIYNLPDSDIMKYFSEEDQNWLINPEEYDVEGDPIILYLPTLEKDANIKAWLIQRVQEGKKVDNVFIKFLPWLAPTISKDLTLATRQIREYEIKFRSWDAEMFSFMNEVIDNITVLPETSLVTTCPYCGEEVSSPISFQNGIRSLFDMASGRKKFGSR